jgi:hypothetical protein
MRLLSDERKSVTSYCRGGLFVRGAARRWLWDVFLVSNQ